MTTHFALTIQLKLASAWNARFDNSEADRGAAMVEYALLIVLIALVAVAAILVAGNAVSGTFSEINSEFEAF